MIIHNASYWGECHCLAVLSKVGIISSYNLCRQQSNSLFFNNLDGFSLEHIKGPNSSTLYVKVKGTGSLFTVCKRDGLHFSFHSSWMSVMSSFLWGMFRLESIFWKEYAIQQQRNALKLDCWSAKLTLTRMLEVFSDCSDSSAGFPGPFNTLW